MTKRTTAEGDQRRYGPNWLFARRGRLKVFTDRMECGGRKIVYDEVESAILCSFRSTFLRIPGYVLTVQTPNRTCHFGLNGDRFWEGELPLEVSRQKGILRYSWLSILVRLILVCGRIKPRN